MSLNGTVNKVYKIFVGNLPWTIGQRELKLYFSEFGHVASSSVVFDRQLGFSKGYGFIAFSTRDAFNSACNKNNHILEGRVLTVNEAKI